MFQNDILVFDWSDADFVLANSTCFTIDLMTKISEKASLMKKGSWMITFSKKIANADPLQIKDEEKRDWECVLSIKKFMSWGAATVNVQRKIR